MNDLPTTFTRNIRHFFKEEGEMWLANLPTLLDYCEKRWSLRIQSPFELSVNYVAPANLQDGTEVVVKLSVPNHEFLNELEALKQFNGMGMVKLLDYAVGKGVLLLEKIEPGEMLSTIEDDEKTTRIAANVMKKLYRPAPEDTQIPTIKNREESLINICKQHLNGLGPITSEILTEANTLFQYMVKTIEKQYLLHGDFHHYNILSHGNDEWVAIDPKGLIGEVEYDLIQFLLNQLPNENVREVIERRINIFVEELGLDKERFLQWGFCHSVLSTCWSVGDDGSYAESFFGTIDIFRELLIQRGHLL